MTPLRILVVSEGVPGHDRSSLGIVAAIERHRTVATLLLPVKETRRGSRRVKRMLARVLPFSVFWRSFYDIGDRINAANPIARTNAIPEGSFDLVLSTGPATAAANIALARHFGAKNIYFGFPQWPVTGAFTLLLCPAAAGRHPNVAYALRPSELDATTLPKPRPLIFDAPRNAAILIGGDTKHYRYTEADFRLLAERIVAVSRDLPQLRWTVFDSRRTPEKPFAAFVQFVAASGAPVDVVSYAAGGLLSNKQAFESDLLLVTADSMSMISEAIAGGRPTGVIFPEDYSAPKRDAREHATLLSQRRLFRLSFSDLSKENLAAGAAALALVDGSELDRLYATIMRHGI